MPFELGHKITRHRLMMEGALRKAAMQDNGNRLRRAAERLLDSAADGATWHERMAAFNVLADRLDGKAAQRLNVTHEDTRTLSLADVTALILQARSADAETIEAAPAIASSDGDDA